MRVSVKMFIVVLVTAMSFLGGQAVLAEVEFEEVFGTVKVVNRDANAISIIIVSTTAEGYAGGDEIVIKGFPFDYLEKEEQLGAEITEDDCVGVNFFLKEPPDEEKEDFWKFESLYAFCNDPEVACSDPDDCDVGGEIEQPGLGPEYKHWNRMNNPNN